jgi:hypothetical protein
MSGRIVGLVFRALERLIAGRMAIHAPRMRQDFSKLRENRL